MSNSEERGTGRSTRQILDAPQGAVYVVPGHHSVWYFRDLARHLKRLDLVIVTPNASLTFRSNPRDYVIDHSVELTPFQRALVDFHNRK